MPPQAPPQMPPTVSGPLHQVPCPHCGKPNDFRPLQEQQLCETGSEVNCDHCNLVMDIVAIQPVTILTVRKSRRWGSRPAPKQEIPQQATTISPRMVRRR